MKILFTADWHIKLGQKNVPKDWQKNRYLQLFDLILEPDVDLIIIGGDIFDTVPSLEELELYFEFLKRLEGQTVLIYPGNHEAVKKNTTFLTSLKSVTSVCGAAIVDDYYSFENVDIIPYNKLREFKPSEFSGNLLFTHVRGSIPPHVRPEIDLKKLERWKLVLAGDLHSHSNSQLNIVYPGEPLTTTFHRSAKITGYIIIDSSTLEWSWHEMKLPQLIRKRISDPSEMVVTDFDHTIYELEGDMASLKTIEVNKEVLDKKIIKKEHKASLNLQKLSLEDELSLYLKEILKLDKNRIEEVVSLLNDYTKQIAME